MVSRFKKIKPPKFLAIFFGLLNLAIAFFVFIAAYSDYVNLGLELPALSNYNGLSFYTLLVGCLVLLGINIFFLKQKLPRLLIVLVVNVVLLVAIYLLARYFFGKASVILPSAIIVN